MHMHTHVHVQTKKVAMEAAGLDPNNADDALAFDILFKSETSRTSSKVKNDLSKLFVDTLLTLNNLPPITDPGMPNPPNLERHKPAFKELKEPPAPFSSSSPIVSLG